ncbi:AraC family transcriptional regulator [Spirosoma aerophilum]
MLQELLVVQQFETNQWPFAVQTHTHFELIIVRAGNGTHVVNGNRFRYQAGDVFFLGPQDTHHFVVERETSFYCLSFSDLYLASLPVTSHMPWQRIGAYTQQSNQRIAGSLITNQTEQQTMTALVEILLAEQSARHQLFSNPIVESLMRTILGLLDRHLSQQVLRPVTPQASASSLIQQIAAYVCRHITEPDCLRMEKMADVFNYSQSHLSALFKQQVGESIQQYIIRYKLQLVETRLSLSTMSISQIAEELGFTDVCHLNKLFKRYYQRTPTDYRRTLASTYPASATCTA